MLRHVTMILLVAAALAATIYCAQSKPLFPEGRSQDGEDKKGQEVKEEEAVDLSLLTPYKRVGLIRFAERGDGRAGEKRFMSIILGRLKNAQPDTEFVEIEVSLDPDTPLMGEKSRELGQEFGLDAIVTGTFVVKVVGGLYPTIANSVPAGRVGIECRVIDTVSGWSRGTAAVAWDKNKIYPMSVKTQKDLEGKLMRDGAEDLIAELNKKGLLYFEPEPDAAGESAVAEGGQESAESESRD